MDSASVLDLAVSIHYQPQMSRKSSGKRSTKRSPEEKQNAGELFNSGKTKAEVSRMLGIPESTLRGWLKQAIYLVSHGPSSESSPCWSVSAISGESNNDLQEVQKMENNNHLKTMSVAAGAKRVSDEWIQLVAQTVQQNENRQQSMGTITPVPIKGKRKRKSQQEFLEESRKVSQDWLQLQQQHQKVTGESVTLTPNWKPLLQDRMTNDPQVHQKLLHRQFVQEQLQQQSQQQLINPFVTPEMVQQFEMLRLARMMQQINQAHTNSSSTSQPPSRKRRKICPKPTMDTPVDNQLLKVVQVQNLSLIGKYNSPLGGQSEELEPVVVPSPILSPISTTEVKQKRERRSKLKMAMANASMNHSEAGQQPKVVELTTPSSKTAEVKQRKNKKSKIEVDPMIKLNEYFDTEYFMLHDWLLMQQQTIGERIIPV